MRWIICLKAEFFRGKHVKFCYTLFFLIFWRVWEELYWSIVSSTSSMLPLLKIGETFATFSCSGKISSLNISGSLVTFYWLKSFFKFFKSEVFLSIFFSTGNGKSSNVFCILLARFGLTLVNYLLNSYTM